MIDVVKEQIGSGLILSGFKLSLGDETVCSYVCDCIKEDYLETEGERLFLFYLSKYRRENKCVPSLEELNYYVEEKLGCNKEKHEIISKYFSRLKAHEITTLEKERLLTSLDKHVTVRELYKSFLSFQDKASREGLLDASMGLFDNLSNTLYKKKSPFKGASLLGDIDGSLIKAKERIQEDDKIPTGIDSYDNYNFSTGGVRGGIAKGTSFLCIGRSGTGKSTFLRSLCYHASIYGHDVIHIQAEGLDMHMKLAYTSMFSGVPLSRLMSGDYDVSSVRKRISERLKKLKVVTGAERIGNIYTHTFDNFNSPSIHECKRFIEYIYNKKRAGRLSLVVVDYLDLFMSVYAEGSLERKKKVAEQFTRMAIDYNLVFATATQTVSLPSSFINGESEGGNEPVPGLITSNHVSLDKQVINPFSCVLSINQSREEDRNNRLRLYEVKERHGERSKSPVHTISMYREYGHFICNPFTALG